jgi:hypothetical protein
MRLGWLAWYISGMLALLSIFSLLISYAPGANTFAMGMQVGCACAALAGMGLALWLRRFPQEHWVNRSRPLWAAFIAAAVTVTVLTVLVA